MIASATLREREAADTASDDQNLHVIRWQSSLVLGAARESARRR